MSKLFSTLFVFLMVIPFGLHSQTLDLNFTHDGLARQSKVFLPDSYTDDNEYPLVLLMHGLGGNGSNMLSTSGFTSVSNNADNPFIVVSPTATFQELFGATEWNEGLNPAHTVDDISYLNALLDSVISQYSVAENRIYSTGFSDGGFMTNRLACEMNNRIAAFASVGGTRASAISCDPERGIPLFHIHGTGDEVVDYYGEFLLGNAFLASLFISVDELMTAWTGANSCEADIAPISIGENTEAYYYSACDDATETWLYKVNGGDHSWQLTPDFNTAGVIWEFFEQYSLTLDVTENIQEPLVDIFPNPSQNEFNIFSDQRIDSWELYDSSGQLVKSRLANNSTIRINEQLTEGVYILKLNLSDRVITRKLIVD